MIYIPTGKALTAVEITNGCIGCEFAEKDCPEYDLGADSPYMPCKASDRQDGKEVIFKLVDMEYEKRKETT